MSLQEQLDRARRTDCDDTFHWIGQPLSSCDLCGKPYWEHRFRHTFGEEMRVADRVEITDADAVKAKWGPPVSSSQENP